MWFQMIRNNKIPVTEELLKLKAIELKDEFLKKLECDDMKEELSLFTASNGWILRFRKRHSIKSVMLSGDSFSVDPVAEEKGRNELQAITKNFHPDDIFNADETALYFRLVPSRSLVQ